MIIARWSFSTLFTKTDECIGALREWAIDVGERTGWKVGSLRVMRGGIGAPENEIEIESHFEGLGELESAWDDMESAPRQREHMQRLAAYIVPGTSRWRVYREVKLSRD